MLLTFQKVIQPIAILLEQIAVQNFMHIALTGGQLYKSGERKDVDFIVYHLRGKSQNEDDTDFTNFLLDLRKEGFGDVNEFGFVTKTTYEGIDIDILYPEYDGNGTYPIKEEPTVPPLDLPSFLLPGKK